MLDKSSDQNLLIAKVRKTIDSHHLLERGDAVLIGVSGGPDSMCLLHVIQTLSLRYGFSIEVAHVNHLLRGEESESDQAFVSRYCASSGIPFFTCTVDVAAYSREQAIGIEEAARDVRYRFFQECVRNRPMKVAVAHHRQDQAETILLNLIRGCGLDGLRGMEYLVGNLIRPLLDCAREEIDSYIAAHGIPYRIDRTNGESCADRNRIRLELVPYIRTLFGRDIASSILNTRELCLHDADYLDQVSRQAFQSVSEKDALPCGALLEWKPAISSRMVRLLFEHFKGDKKNLTYRQTEAILRMVQRGKDGSAVHLADGLCATLRHHSLLITTRVEFQEQTQRDAETSARRKSVRIPLLIPCERYEEEINRFICTKLVENPQKVDYNSMARYFPVETAGGAVWRFRNEGDWIRPNGNSGKKMLKKYLIDEKVPREERDALLLLAKRTEILWIPDLSHRQAHRTVDALETPDALDVPDSLETPDALVAPDALDTPNALDAPDALEAMCQRNLDLAENDVMRFVLIQLTHRS